MKTPGKQLYALGQPAGQSRLAGGIFACFPGGLSNVFNAFFRSFSGSGPVRPLLYYNACTPHGGGRFCKGKGMKGLLFLVAAVILLGPLPTAARDGGFNPFLQVQDQRYGRKDYRESRRGGQDFRREKQGRPSRDERYHGRMTDEERRELRRDVDRANREIYRRNPPR